MGSFLNVVVYRIPVGLSVRDPASSFCPRCGKRIRWFDNIPLVSFLRLRARSRCCDGPISVRYPLIETATAVIVLLLLDAFFVGQVREGLYDGAIGLTWRLAEDWPIFLAHVVLFACLLAMSAIDIEHYWIDTALARFAFVAGFVLHGLWTPRHSVAVAGRGVGWLRPWDSTAIACSAAFLGLVAVWIATRFWRPARDGGEDSLTAETPSSAGSHAAPGWHAALDPQDYELAEDESAGAAFGASVGLANGPVETKPAYSRRLLAGWGLALVLTVQIVVIAMAALKDGPPTSTAMRYGLPLLGFCVLIAGIGAVSRPSDQEVVESIESERPWARKIALLELLHLSPAFLLASIALYVYFRSPIAAKWFESVLHWSPTIEWRPVLGLATAASGFVIGAGIGWAVRIIATLIYGKEALGEGDVYMMAAAGCIAGWPVVLLGFVLTSLLALAGWVVALPLKRTRAIPLGPWLSVAFLATVTFYESLLEFPPIKSVIEVTQWLMFGRA